MLRRTCPFIFVLRLKCVRISYLSKWNHKPLIIGTKEITLIITAVLLLGVALFAISKIRNLNVSKSYNFFLYLISILIPVLGLLLVLRAEKKSSIKQDWPKHHQQFGLEFQYSTLVYNFHKIFSIKNLCRLDIQWIPCLQQYLSVVSKRTLN